MNADNKVSLIAHCACVACAALAVQPIPFADILILTSIQAYFASRIAAIRGVPVSKLRAFGVIKELINIAGLAILAQQIVLVIWKLVAFGFVGGLLTVPIIYSLTYGIMKALDAYFSAKAKSAKLSGKEIEKIWKSAKQEGDKETNKYRKKARDNNRAINDARESFDDILIIGLLAFLAFGDKETELSESDLAVLSALKRADQSLSDSSLSEIGDYLRSCDTEQIVGLVSNVKDALRETEFARLENENDDSAYNLHYDQEWIKEIATSSEDLADNMSKIDDEWLWD